MGGYHFGDGFGIRLVLKRRTPRDHPGAYSVGSPALAGLADEPKYGRIRTTELAYFFLFLSRAILRQWDNLSPANIAKKIESAIVFPKNLFGGKKNLYICNEKAKG